jgi:limonene-1,2-epoxide hydrolase
LEVDLATQRPPGVARTSAAPETEGKETVERPRALSVFEGRRDAWLREDVDTYLGYFSDDVVFEGPAGSPLTGLEAYGGLVRASLKAVRPVSFEYHDIAVHGDHVFAEWTQSVEVRADRRVLVWRGMSICELRRRKIVWWREYYDPALLRTAESPEATTSDSDA